MMSQIKYFTLTFHIVDHLIFDKIATKIKVNDVLDQIGVDGDVDDVQRSNWLKLQQGCFDELNFFGSPGVQNNVT